MNHAFPRYLKVARCTTIQTAFHIVIVFDPVGDIVEDSIGKSPCSPVGVVSLEFNAMEWVLFEASAAFASGVLGRMPVVGTAPPFLSIRVTEDEVVNMAGIVSELMIDWFLVDAPDRVQDLCARS